MSKEFLNWVQMKGTMFWTSVIAIDADGMHQNSYLSYSDRKIDGPQWEFFSW